MISIHPWPRLNSNIILDADELITGSIIWARSLDRLRRYWLARAADRFFGASATSGLPKPISTRKAPNVSL